MHATAEEDVSHAFSPMLRASDVAAAEGVAPSTVASSRESVAGAWLEEMDRLLADFVQVCRSKQPALVIDVLKWDEAKLNMLCNGFRELAATISTTALSWSVLLSKRYIFAVWDDGRIAQLPLAIPAGVLLEVNASTLYASLFEGVAERWGQRISEAIAAAADSARIRGTDRASANLKLVAHEFSKRE